MKLNIKYVLKCLLILVLFINIQVVRTEDVATTLETIIVETTTELVTIITDIPQSDVEIAINHDYGKFTTMVYNYINSQYSNLDPNERCLDDYTKCLISLSVAAPVCVINDSFSFGGIMSYSNYCDAYFDNCFRKMRFWRIVDFGVCRKDHQTHFDIDPTRKRRVNSFFLKHNKQ